MKDGGKIENTCMHDVGANVTIKENIGLMHQYGFVLKKTITEVEIWALVLLFISEISALSFMLPQNTRKCLMEEIHKDVLVTGEYKLSPAPGHKTSLKVGDSKGHTLYSKEDALEGKFAFTTDDKEVVEICFISKIDPGVRAAPSREVFLDVKHGVEAKSYEDVAKSEKLKPMEIELRRLEDLSEAIVNDFAYMKKREEEMRDTNVSRRKYGLNIILSMYVHLCEHKNPVSFDRFERSFKSQPIQEFCTLASFQCAVCCVWPPGKSFTSDDTSSPRSSLNRKR
ncbi:putative transmembrane emp24 domain-containing protein 10 [Apostichopus japonicus]|uniref:Putative transmembrane emp24 domain-containing protein 10 n=1 Tax=Stichopus japonicus TaxID=307972 RepID=A0A2G8L9Z7_STIJA|nr:putative transmembrane emp24 domain-containing protein 10 [Apostichopus japonicus]